MLITRRQVLTGLAATSAGVAGLGGYAFALEPRFRLIVAKHTVASPAWPAAYPSLRIAIITDLHTCDPWMPVERIEEIVVRTLSLEPDVIVMLGDIAAGMPKYRIRAIPPEEWAVPLSRLRAPLGVHAVLGNHDWWTDIDAIRFGLIRAGIPIYENDAVRLRIGRERFWLAGLGDQLAFQDKGGVYYGPDDLPATLASAHDGNPVVLMVHEPDIFTEMPDQVAVTLAGHTHGGQVNLPIIGRPIVPSQFGQRFAYGHIIEDDRHMIVSGGLGCSIFPVRFGVPPEITLVTLQSAE